MRSLADWLAEHHPEIGPAEDGSPGVRHFCGWLESEGEATQDATAGIRTPAPGDPETPVLSMPTFGALLAACTGTNLTARRDAAIIMPFLEAGCGSPSWPHGPAPHAFRHTWAHAFRAAGGIEGDLMLLGGWRGRAMLDRYGKAAAADRAADAYRRLSLGDRI